MFILHRQTTFEMNRPASNDAQIHHFHRLVTNSPPLHCTEYATKCGDELTKILNTYQQYI